MNEVYVKECWMYCSGCLSKLYSFTGTKDTERSCPHEEKCKKEKQK